MKKLLIAILLFSTTGVFAQNVTKENFENEIKTINENIKSLQSDFENKIKLLNDTIKIIQSENEKIKSEIDTLNSKLTNATFMLDSLQKKTKANSNKIYQTSNKLEIKIQETEKLKNKIDTINSKLSKTTLELDSLQKQTDANESAITQTNNELGIKINKTGKSNEEKISAVVRSLSKNSIYGIIGVLLAILLSVLLYWLLSKKQKTDRSTIEEQLSKTKKSLIEDGAKLDKNLAEIIHKQLKIIESERAKRVDETKIDHSFHLKGANELMRIKNYANILNPESQDAIALKSALDRLDNTYRAYNYEIIDLAGHEYDDRIPIDVKESIYDKTLPFGNEVIVKILKPLVKYKGITIQDPQVITKYNK